MEPEILASVISILVAISVLTAGFFQQIVITCEKPVMKTWVKVFYVVMVLLLLLSLKLVLCG